MSALLEYKGYHGSIEFDVEDEVLHGRILYVNDLVNFEGQTIPELKGAFEEAVDDYLEFCNEEGREPDKPFSGSFNVRIGRELHRKAAIWGVQHQKKLNQVVVLAVEKLVSEKSEEVLHIYKHHHVVGHTSRTDEIRFEYESPKEEGGGWRVN